MVVGDRAVGITVEFSEPAQIVPYGLIVGVENMSAVAVDLDALHFLRVDIPSDVLPLFYHQDGLSAGPRLLGERGAKESRADDQIVILHLKTSTSIRFRGPEPSII